MIGRSGYLNLWESMTKVRMVNKVDTKHSPDHIDIQMSAKYLSSAVKAAFSLHLSAHLPVRLMKVYILGCLNMSHLPFFSFMGGLKGGRLVRSSTGLSPGPSMHMWCWSFLGGNLEQLRATGQGNPNSWRTGWQRLWTLKHIGLHGPIGSSTFSVHIGTYTEHRKNFSCCEQPYWIRGVKVCSCNSASCCRSCPTRFGIPVTLYPSPLHISIRIGSHFLTISVPSDPYRKNRHTITVKLWNLFRYSIMAKSGTGDLSWSKAW